MDEPDAIADARRLVARDTRLNVVTVVAPLSFAAAILLSVATGVEQTLALPLMITMMGSMAGLFARRVMAKTEVEAAKRRITAWEERPHEDVAPEPQDERWSAVRVLVRRIVELGADVDGVPQVATDAEARLGRMLADLRLLEEAVVADRALDTGDGERHFALGAVRDRKEADVRAVVDGLRDLHAGLAAREASAGDPMMANIGELVRRVAADAEVDATTEARKAVDDRLRRASAARTHE